VKLRKEEKLTIMSFIREEKNVEKRGGTRLGITKFSLQYKKVMIFFQNQEMIFPKSSNP